MAIDDPFLERIAALGSEQHFLRGGSVAILGDCRFLTSWASGDNHRDLLEFQRRYKLARAETLDISGTPTIQLDLHAPLPDALRGQFDMVIDAGTMHCCFDVARVMENILAMMKDRAAVLHISAFVGFTGRCFYKIDPSLFRDFYEQNGFSQVDLWARAGSAQNFPSRVIRKVRHLLGVSVSPVQQIPPGAIAIKSASIFGFDFTGQWKGRAPATLPNDAVIMCAAWRETAQPFIRPIPSFFSK